MKKVLSVAMASAMVLGMGANAFAIQYSTGSNETASWPKGFAFDGQLFVTNADGDIIEDSTTQLNDSKAVDFMPGDVIWMPLYANDQRVYNVIGGGSGLDEVASRTEYLSASVGSTTNGVVNVDEKSNIGDFTYMDDKNKVVYYYGTGVDGKQYAESYAKANKGWRAVQLKNPVLVEYVNGSYKTTSNAFTDNTVADKDVYEVKSVQVSGLTMKKVAGGAWNKNESPRVTVTKGSKSITKTAKVANTDTNADITVELTEADLKNLGVELPAKVHSYDEYNLPVTFTASSHALATEEASLGDASVELKIYNATKTESTAKTNLYVRINLPKVDSTNDQTGTIIGNNTDVTDTDAVYVDYGHYTGNIDKNWSINLIEKDGTVKDLIEKAELYKATAADVTSYSKYTDEVVANGVYLKVTLKDEWKTTDEETLKYYVYVANNKNNSKTNEVWVSGNYAADYRTVDFTWTNNANKAGLWKAEDNGIAVFDFADKAFFTVKMYKGETMYLDLSTAYDKAIAGEMDVEADSFYKFDKTNANFAREGELVIVTDDDTLVPYEIDEDGNFVELDAEYVENYLIKNSNAKVNGFKFNTKQLGNYVLSTEELGAEDEEVPEEDEEPADNEPAEVETPEVDEEPAPETNKPNPETGAEDFVGLAVSLAVVSVAAAGALALKK